MQVPRLERGLRSVTPLPWDPATTRRLEALIATGRCRYHGEDGINRWVGLGGIASNLVSTATFLNARATA